MSERSVDEDQVRADHLREVDSVAQWAYLVTVIMAGTLLMLGLIAVLGASGS
jgi:hypothetical protein